MDTISLDELNALIEYKSPECNAVSIFMPTFKTGAETKQNPLVLEKLLARAESQLLAASFTRAADAHKYMAPVKDLLDSKAAWQHPQDGLAIFLSQDSFRYYSLPFRFNETVSVYFRFSIRPLIPLFNKEGWFYVLALSQNSVRLIQCTHDGSNQISLTGIVPSSLREASPPPTTDRGFQTHTGLPGKGKEANVFHVQVTEKLDENRILSYFQQINRGLTQNILQDQGVPLVIAGDEQLHPVYKKTNTYKHLYQEGIVGNPDKISNETLREKAFALLQPYFDRNKANTLREYRELAGTGHLAQNIADIAENAYSGKVERLLIVSDSQIWGSFDSDSGKATVHAKPEPCDIDLIDFAAANTLLHRGKVYIAQPGEILDGADVAAVTRHGIHHPKTGHPGAA